MYRIIATEGPEIRSAWTLDASASIGRDDACTIVIDDPAMSRTHAKLSIQDDRLMLHDCDSANGVWMDTQQISSKQLRDGDCFRLGTSTFRIERMQPPAESATPTRTAAAANGKRTFTVKRSDTATTTAAPAENPPPRSKRVAIAALLAIGLALGAIGIDAKLDDAETNAQTASNQAEPIAPPTFPGAASELPRILADANGLNVLQNDLNQWLHGRYDAAGAHAFARLDESLKDPAYRHALIQHELLRQAKDALVYIQNDLPDGQPFLEAFLADPAWMEYLFCGPPGNLPSALGHLHAIWKTDSDAAKYDVYKKLSAAVALHSNGNVKANPTPLVGKYMWYRKHYALGKSGSLFPKYTVYDVYWAIDVRDPLNVMDWVTYSKQSKGYRKDFNIYGTRVHSAHFRRPWSWHYAWVKQEHLNPGVCGSVSRRGFADSQIKGIAACTGSQPGHAIWGKKMPNGLWSTQYSVGGRTLMECDKWSGGSKGDRFVDTSLYYNRTADVLQINRLFWQIHLLGDRSADVGAAARMIRQTLPVHNPDVIKQLAPLQKQEDQYAQQLVRDFQSAPSGGAELPDADLKRATRGILRFTTQDAFWHYRSRELRLSINGAPFTYPIGGVKGDQYLELPTSLLAMLADENQITVSNPNGRLSSTGGPWAKFGISGLQLAIQLPDGSWRLSNKNDTLYRHQDGYTGHWRRPKHFNHWEINGQKLQKMPPATLRFSEAVAVNP